MFEKQITNDVAVYDIAGTLRKEQSPARKLLPFATRFS